MAKDGRNIAIASGLAAVAIGAFWLLKKPGGIPLQEGWNEVTYTGKSQIAGVAMQSIIDYMVISYYYDPFAGIWIGIVYDTIFEPGMVLNIKVSEDCVWSF